MGGELLLHCCSTIRQNPQKSPRPELLMTGIEKKVLEELHSVLHFMSPHPVLMYPPFFLCDCLRSEEQLLTWDSCTHVGWLPLEATSASSASCYLVTSPEISGLGCRGPFCEFLGVRNA